MQPEISALFHVHLIAGALNDQHLLDHVAGNLAGFVRIHFERHQPPAAHAFIGGDEEFGIAIGDPACQGFWAEAAKHNRMHRANARAGEHRISGLNNHRHVDGDAVALLNAHAFEDIGKFTNRRMGLFVGDLVALTRLIALKNDGDLVAACFQMPVEAIIANVQLAI